MKPTDAIVVARACAVHQMLLALANALPRGETRDDALAAAKQAERLQEDLETLRAVHTDRRAPLPAGQHIELGGACPVMPTLTFEKFLRTEKLEARAA